MANELLSDAEIAMLLGRRDEQSAGAGASDALYEELTRIHEPCARYFGAELSALVRRTARVRLARVQPQASSDFCARTELPSFVTRLAVRPFQQPWLLEFRPSALFPIIDCLLGGGREKTPIARRPLTEIESRLAARVVRVLLEALQASWSANAAVAFPGEVTCARIGEGVQDEPMAVMIFELDVAGSQGTLHLAIPQDEVTRLLERPNPPQAAAPAVAPDAGSQMVAQLREVSIEPEELAALAEGDVIITEHRASEPILVMQDGIPRFEARLGAWHGNKAIEIERVIADESRPDAG